MIILPQVQWIVKKQDDMSEEEFENYYTDNGGENCTYYEENVINE